MQLAAHYPVQLLCDLMDLPRSSFYYPAHPRDDTMLQEQIRAVGGAWPTYGVPRVTAQIERDFKVVVNHPCLPQGKRKRVYRVMGALDLTQKKRRKTRRTTQSDHALPRYPNLVHAVTITHPEQVWVADIIYVQLEVEDVYLAVIMDVFTRTIRSWHLSRALDQELTLTALRRALEHHRAEIHHSDQGVQYAASAYMELLQAQGIAISMAARGEATQNGYAERLIRTFKAERPHLREEEVHLSEYREYQDAYEHLGRFLDDVYQHKRIHSSLGYLTPAESLDGYAIPLGM
jgi:transposase InsO family protein